jgi:endoglucanase
MNMKKITILSFLIMAFAMVSFSACSNEDTIEGGEGLSTDFVVSRSDMAFTKNGGETDLYVKAAQVPTVSTEAAWLAVTPVAGSSSITHHFLIKAEANTANDDRSATITVAAGSDTKTITVSQNSTEGLLITSSKNVNVGAAGGQVTVTLKANASYSQVISNDWVSEITSRANMVEYTRNYSVAANISNARSATISYTMVVNDSTSIPMLVNDDIEIVLDAVIYHLVNTSQPIGIDGASLSICDVTHYPRTRNTDALETGSLHHIPNQPHDCPHLPSCYLSNQKDGK